METNQSAGTSSTSTLTPERVSYLQNFAASGDWPDDDVLLSFSTEELQELVRPLGYEESKNNCKGYLSILLTPSTDTERIDEERLLIAFTRAHAANWPAGEPKGRHGAKNTGVSVVH